MIYAFEFLIKADTEDEAFAAAMQIANQCDEVVEFKSINEDIV